MELLKKFKKRREFSSIVFLIALFLIVGIINPNFLNPSNIMLCLNGATVYTICAIGMAFVIFTGEIDASIGATLGLSAAVSATMIRDGKSFILAVFAAVCIGLIIGAINGVGVSILKVPSIIMTIGVNSVVRGISYVYTHGAWVENVPTSYKQISQKGIGGLSWLYIVTIILMIAIYMYMIKTRRGKFFHAAGDNQDGAEHIGLPVTATKMISYIICAVCASLASLIFVSRIGFVTPTSGNGYEMKAIAACVIGGISLTGGVGNVIGATFGALIMASISRILVFMGFPSTYDNTITGILLIAIVVIDAVIQKRDVENARHERLLAKVSAATDKRTEGRSLNE